MLIFYCFPAFRGGVWILNNGGTRCFALRETWIAPTEANPQIWGLHQTFEERFMELLSGGN
jgi:hypothetical protein